MKTLSLVLLSSLSAGMAQGDTANFDDSFSDGGKAGLWKPTASPFLTILPTDPSKLAPS